MKKIILIICGLLLFASASAQKGFSTCFSKTNHPIEITKGDLKYLLENSIVICSKVDTLDNKGMIKTVEIVCRDTTFKIVGAYLESNIFFPGNNVKLKCDFVVIDEIFTTFELDYFGRKQFEALLNKAPLMELK